MTTQVNGDYTVAFRELLYLGIPVASVATPTVDKEQCFFAGSSDIIVDHETVFGRHAVDNHCSDRRGRGLGFLPAGSESHGSEQNRQNYE